MNFGNEIAIKIYNIIETIPSLSLEEILNILGLDIGRAELYFIIKKIMRINQIIFDHHKESNNKPKGTKLHSEDDD